MWNYQLLVHGSNFLISYTLPSEIEGHRRTLEAGYLVYYKFWWEGLDELLQPVPGCKLKYLPEEHISSLQLDHLSYNESVFWFARNTKSLSDISSRVRKRKDRAGGALAWSSQVIQALVCISHRLLSFTNNCLVS